MATANLYRLQKRHNSTLQPTGTGTTADILLKGGSDFITPTFTMQHSSFPAYNYIKYNNRYYFVTRIKSVRDDLYDIDCEIDVLATFKASIQAMSAYVLYYTHTNSEIADKRLSIKTSETVDSEYGVFDSLGTVSPVDPAIILMVNGKTSVGAYAVRQSDIADMLDNINIDMGNEIATIDFTDLETANDIVDWLTKFGRVIGDWFLSLFGKVVYSGSALENIRSAHILPLSMADIASNPATVYLGNFNSGITGNKISDQLFTDSATVVIPWQGITDWRRLSPYMEMYLYIPYIGLTALSVSDLIGETTLTVYASVDKFSGDSIFQVKTGSGNVIGHYTTNLRTDYPIGSSNVSSSKATGSMISSAAGAATAVAGIATGGSGAIIVGGLAAAGLGLVNMINPTNMSIGGPTGGAILGLSADKAKVTCYSIFHDTVVAPNSVSAIAGTPFNAVMALSGVSGYVQTSGASVAEAAADPVMTDYERNLINQMLDGGIYIE